MDKKKEIKRLIGVGDRISKQKALKLHGDKCELCGGTYRATAHHYFYKRNYPNVRFDYVDNLVILCGQCHSNLHFQDPKTMNRKILVVRGKKWLTQLEKKAFEPHPSSYLTLEFYQKLIEQLKNS